MDLVYRQARKKIGKWIETIINFMFTQRLYKRAGELKNTTTADNAGICEIVFRYKKGGGL
ncbi:MAG: hypothetical protein ACTSQY_11825 [Candidatus Odinarchaeia archaeon]